MVHHHLHGANGTATGEPSRKLIEPKFYFAEFVTTLATGLTIVNVYSTASVSSPPAGLSGLSFRSQRRFGRRTITSSARLYMTMVFPYVAATVLVQNIATEEVAPIFIAAVASISGRFNKGRHTYVEWVFKSLRTFTCMIVLALFMLFRGLSGEIIEEQPNRLTEVYKTELHTSHILFGMITSFRWFVLLFLGFLTVPEKQKKTNVLLAALKILLVWILIEGTGEIVTHGEWGLFDKVITTRTPLRDTVFVLYSILIAFDAAECIASSMVREHQMKIYDGDEDSDIDVESQRQSVCTVSDEEVHFPPVASLRQRSNQSPVLTFEEFYDELSGSIAHFIQLSFSRLRRASIGEDNVASPPHSEDEVNDAADSSSHITAPPMVGSTTLEHGKST